MLRRAALLAAALVVPVVITLVVLINVVRGGHDGGGPVADVDGTTAAPRGDLPPVEVDTPEVTPAAELACPVLMGQLPLELAGEDSRMVRSDSPYAYAWGDPAVVLVCGVAPPAGFVADAATLVVSGVQWFVDTSDPETVVWTTVDRTVPVEVRVPASADSALPTALSPIIATALPYTEPVPGG
ncbi:MAG: uncharacterized protein JWQ26_3449 [Modestobacter sp.]|nr:uncharacterized protein [Modestobacter sp.]HEV7726658.1 DUF3515 domain-containing protein [Modestobacter sp.]